MVVTLTKLKDSDSNSDSSDSSSESSDDEFKPDTDSDSESDTESESDNPAEKVSNKKRKIKAIRTGKKKAKIIHFPKFCIKTPKMENLRDLLDIINDFKEFYTLNLKKYTKNKQHLKQYNEYVQIEYSKYLHLMDAEKDITDLYNMIGLENVKKNILDQIIFTLQGLNGHEVLHTVIVGDPGMGKTTIATIMGMIYAKLGILEHGNLTIARRVDFVGKYLGSTAIKTTELLKNCIGGVLLIDEAYSLGTNSESDSFAKEATDTLNQFLSEHSSEMICIIAGYEKELDECFFNRNPGLKRRFPWKFILEKYNPENLKDIFCLQIKNEKWICAINQDVVIIKIKENVNLFSNFGGDCKTLFDKCKMASSRRTFLLENPELFCITTEDFLEGFKEFKKMKEHKKDESNKYTSVMYI